MSKASPVWADVKIGDLGDVITGRTPPTEQPLYFGDKFPFITPGDMHQGKYARTTERSLSGEGANLLARIVVPPQSVCVSCIGWQMGEVVMTDRPSITNQQINSIIPKNDIDASFLYYSLLPRKRELLSSGSARGVRTPILNKSVFSALTIKVPSRDIQRRIASILGAYDDLIEVNRRRIALLEEMARRLFDEWFPHSLTAAQGRSPLAETNLPDGWTTRTVATFGRVITGKTPSKLNPAFFGSDVPFLKIPDIKGSVFSWITEEGLSAEGAKGQANKTIPRGSICVSCIGTIGSVTITTTVMQTNQQINSVVLEDDIWREFLFLVFKSSRARLLALGSNGATMGNVNKAKFEALHVVAPPEAMVRRYHEAVQPMFDAILNMSLATSRLTQSRDLLLPRLVSGALSVTAAELELEDAA